MVWGMNLPSAFGEFWPDGEFEGWSASLMSYYLKQPPEAQQALLDHPDGAMEAASLYPHYVSEKMICEIGTKIGPEFPLVTPVLPNEAPTSFVTERGYRELGSLVMLNDRILAVDEALKNTIERLEPDVHQFFPIDIRMTEDGFSTSRYYTLVIGQYLDSFVPDKSDRDVFEGKTAKPGFYKLKDGKEDIAGIALSRNAFGNAHLWRERHLGGEWLTCFSDELGSEIAKAGFRIPQLRQMMEL